MKLAQYVFQRLVSYVLVLFIGITITFFLPRLMPNDPINNYISQMQPRRAVALRRSHSTTSRFAYKIIRAGR